MNYFNYFDTLSPVQKKKWAEKQGTLCFYEIFDLLYENFDFAEAGAVLLGLIYYDKVGGAKPLPEDIEKAIDSALGTKVVFKTYTEKIAAATKEWINRHKLKATEEDESALEAEISRRMQTNPEVSKNENIEILPDDLPF